MASVVSSTDPILCSPTSPDSTVYYQYWLNTDNGGLYEYINGEWVDTSGGVNAEPSTEEVKITHIKIVNGIITEFEWEDM